MYKLIDRYTYNIRWGSWHVQVKVITCRYTIICLKMIKFFISIYIHIICTFRTWEGNLNLFAQSLLSQDYYKLSHEDTVWYRFNYTFNFPLTRQYIYSDFIIEQQFLISYLIVRQWQKYNLSLICIARCINDTYFVTS